MEAVFKRTERLIPKPSDLSYYNWNARKASGTDSDNFEARPCRRLHVPLLQSSCTLTGSSTDVMKVGNQCRFVVVVLFHDKYLIGEATKRVQERARTVGATGASEVLKVRESDAGVGKQR